MLRLGSSLLFVRYEEKRWVPRDGKTKSTSSTSAEKVSVHTSRPRSSGEHGYTNSDEHSAVEKKNGQATNTIYTNHISRNTVSVQPKISEQVKLR